ncbi:MAG TPA: hypothetical protein VEM41_08430 [Actinomycetota bacterium]|nr:hypothetical protein [Actinomycetota bacterium]
MSDLDTKLREIERATPPQMWSEIEERARSAHPSVRVSVRRRWPVVVLAVTLAAGAVALALVAFGSRRSITPVAGPPAGGLLVEYWASISSNSSQIWAVSPAGTGGRVFIADGPHVYDKDAVWSPDGTRVAFLRGSRTREPPAWTRGLWVMNADGSGLRQLAGTQFANDLAWSPDGRTIAFSSTGPRGLGPSSLDVVALDSGRVTRILQGDYVDPSFSPDGRRLAVIAGFDSNTGTSSLEVADVDGSGLHPIGPSRGLYRSASWSPTGDWIAVQWAAGPNRSLDNDIWLISPSGAPPRRLTDHYGWDGQPVWSPDGSRIAFASDRCANPADVRAWIRRGDGPWLRCVYVMNADGSRVHEVFRRGSFYSAPTGWRAGN